jgi:hypothetical protein
VREELARPDTGRAVAALAVVGAGLALMVLPALVAVAAGTGGPARLVAVVAGLAGVLGGVKLAAMALGLAASVD